MSYLFTKAIVVPPLKVAARLFRGEGVFLAGLVILMIACINPATAQKISISGAYTRDHDIMTVDGTFSVRDSLHLTLQAGKLHFNFATFFDYGHSCGMEGIAAKVENYYEYKETLDDGNVCQLRIRVTGSEAKLEDVGNGCRLFYCGMRGYIEGSTFYKAKK